MKRSTSARRQPSALTLELARQMRDVRGTLTKQGRKLRSHERQLANQSKSIRDIRRERRWLKRAVASIAADLGEVRHELTVARQRNEEIDSQVREAIRAAAKEIVDSVKSAASDALRRTVEELRTAGALPAASRTRKRKEA